MDILAPFALFSVLGWVLEVGYRSFTSKRFVNPGLLRGPYLVLYGTGALVLIAAGSLIGGAGPIVRALVYLALMTGLELAAGLIAHYLFKVRLWDYSDQPLNYRGYICPRFSAYWVTAAFAFEAFIYPAYEKAAAAAPSVVVVLPTLVILAAIASDLLAVSVKNFLAVTPDEERILNEQYAAIAGPLLERPEVAALSRYPHHLAKTRLMHVDEVARVSFLWGKKLSLDCDAIVRGALLHDLFHYDWLSGGPRLHGFRHPRIALDNAKRITALTKKEQDIIMKHMWPLTIVPPLSLESFIVSCADTFCAARDYLSLAKLGDSLREDVIRFVRRPSEQWIRQAVLSGTRRVRAIRSALPKVSRPRFRRLRVR